jgi:hypothetical protein
MTIRGTLGACVEGLVGTLPADRLRRSIWVKASDAPPEVGGCTFCDADVCMLLGTAADRRLLARGDVEGESSYSSAASRATAAAVGLTGWF